MGDPKDKEGVVYAHNDPTYPPRKAMQATESAPNSVHHEGLLLHLLTKSGNKSFLKRYPE